MHEADPTYEPSVYPSEAAPSDAADADTAPSLSTHTLRRLLYLAFAVLAVMLLVLLPPYISVNRYQRRIATSIGDSLGRPVHLDKVSLNLLPLPGFTLENFVVEEDPAFGSEPVIRANSVRATLRLSSLWSRRVEFSTISFTEPSVNLVHTSDGKWNLESILLHAAHISAAPTAQRQAGPAPRFPYIEATGARLNLKLDREKSPISLTDADFALWLPDPQQWHLRLSAHPARTDTDVSDTGVFELEGTLSRAPSLGQVPINLRGTWRNAPLGAASRFLLGRDAGLRGEMTLTANAQGTIDNSKVQARLLLTDTRRADFVPAQPMDIDLQCLGSATGDFHSFEDLRCSWPPAGSSDAPILALTGTVPDLRNPKSAELQLGTPGLPAATLLEWLRVASNRIPTDISAAGALTGNLSYAPSPTGTLPWHGDLVVANASLIDPHAGTTSLVTGDVALHSTTAPSPKAAQSKHRKPAPPTADGFQLDPVSLALGGKDPATLEGHLDAAGCTFHLTGMASTARLLTLATALPQLGDGLVEVLPTNRATGPYRIDLTATRPWGQPQTWTDTSPHTPAPRPHR
ncbi:AsmA family protein [Tunturibacter empetritectus]|uniref:AsmA protein n=1 Tax=Tunturiibacter lichenicola TaxID=2051959 RepID=A0A7W8N2H8_9BACT|nr:AsmA family protein [Edaphobacter lichenicola]MBB5342408.1 AsmA protein [Edaphobacter lichenicola]